jgi:hypothetical protein
VRGLQVFNAAQAQTRGMELSKMLWLKSASSEVWLERRTNYTRSLAVMSMAGYILGTTTQPWSGVGRGAVLVWLAHVLAFLGLGMSCSHGSDAQIN